MTSPLFRKDSKGLVSILTANTLVSDEIVSFLGDSPVALKDLSRAMIALEDQPTERMLLDSLSEPETPVDQPTEQPQPDESQPEPEPEPVQQ